MRVCLDFIQYPVKTTDLSHVTDKLYHITSYGVKEYTSIPWRGRDSKYKFSVDDLVGSLTILRLIIVSSFLNFHFSNQIKSRIVGHHFVPSVI